MTDSRHRMCHIDSFIAHRRADFYCLAGHAIGPSRKGVRCIPRWMILVGLTLEGAGVGLMEGMVSAIIVV